VKNIKVKEKGMEITKNKLKSSVITFILLEDLFKVLVRKKVVLVQ